jgi:hypothetical protein
MDESHNFRPQAVQTRKSGLMMWLVLALLAMIALAAGGYAMLRNDQLSSVFDLRSETGGMAAAGPLPSPSASESSATVAEARAAVQRVERVAQQQGGLDARVAAMEQRLTRLDLQTQAAAGNAARAEGLLIAFASRRAIERGAPLGYLADQLRLRFGDARPNAVRTVIAAGQNPVTLDVLLARLDALAPSLADAPAEEGFFTSVGRELAAAFVVRREDTPSPAAERRLERARMFLQSGRAQDALTEVRNLPNAVAARDWIRDAERYANAQDALELLETAAVLEARDLRDGDGELVLQANPAE